MDIMIAAGLVLRPDGRTLLVRKAGTHAFPAARRQDRRRGSRRGRPVPRACRGNRIAGGCGTASRIRPVRARAANEPGRQVVADLFLLHLPEGAEIVPGAEIAEARWVDPACDDLPLAPLTGEEILPRWVSGAFAPQQAG